VEVEAPVAGSATVWVPVLAVAVVHVAVPAALATASVANNYDPVGKHFSNHDDHCRRVVLFVLAHNPNPGHSLADEPLDWD
jgi:hypothetical protein